MAGTTPTPLGASTLNRKWYLDVNTNTAVSPTWVRVNGITSFQPVPDEADFQDDSDFDSEGAKSQTKTAYAWSITLTVARKVTTADATVYDPGQEWLRTHAIGKMGSLNSVMLRYYEITTSGPEVEAYSGTAGVQWAPQGGDMPALALVDVTLNGQGKLTAITHPEA